MPAGPPQAVRVVGVSKYVSAEITSWLIEAGCVDLGENRVQHLRGKVDAAASIDNLNRARWHMIGHLQRNKVRQVLPLATMIHSVDSVRLLAAIASACELRSEPVEMLIEVNVSGEDDKTGLPPGELSELIDRVAELPADKIRCVGLMAMAGWGTDGADARGQFETLRHLAERARERSSLALPELSMGMSGDFAEAIAEGSTMVRIGSRLFEGLR